jgi:16S rRNA (cytosine1402-N4)-methyltransferase
LHRPVMVKEVVDWLMPRPAGIYIDGTVGEGGHSQAILEASAPTGRIIGFDRDNEALAAANEALQPFAERVTLIHEHYREARAVVAAMGLSGVDGILLDLGVSSRQLDASARGFSFQAQGPLDMRMDLRESIRASDLVNRLPEPELARIIYEYGEERYSRRIARAVVRRRKSGPILTTQALVDVIREAVPPPYLHGRLHYATRTFQALRIAVNHELDDLKPSLGMFADLLLRGGRLAVLSFHSLEDRIVKQTFRALGGGATGEFQVLTKRPLTPSSEECVINPRARSAKLRVLARKEVTA